MTSQHISQWQFQHCIVFLSFEECSCKHNSIVCILILCHRLPHIHAHVCGLIPTELSPSNKQKKTSTQNHFLFRCIKFYRIIQRLHCMHKITTTSSIFICLRMEWNETYASLSYCAMLSSLLATIIIHREKKPVSVCVRKIFWFFIICFYSKSINLLEVYTVQFTAWLKRALLEWISRCISTSTCIDDWRICQFLGNGQNQSQSHAIKYAKVKRKILTQK